MAGASDKARFYLEQGVPELQKLLKEEIFTPSQISDITARRSTFEHKLAARGESRPADYIRYAEWEMNLDSLVKRRAKKASKRIGWYHGEQKVLNIFERGTRKFKGDVGLWMQYIDFAKKVGATNKVPKIFAQLLRLHNGKPELWVLAARYALEQDGDTAGARSYMQRGIRFNERSRKLWLEYARLEMIYIAKIAGRARILGLDQEKEEPEEVIVDDHMADVVALPKVTAEDMMDESEKLDVMSKQQVETLKDTPVLTGAIPKAIFDAAMKKFQNSASLAAEFFDMFAEFKDVPTLRNILQHVLKHMQTTAASDALTTICGFKLPLASISPNSAEIPAALRESLALIKAAVLQHPDRASDISDAVVRWLLPMLRIENLDAAIEKVIVASVRQYIRLAGGETGDRLVEVAVELADSKREQDASTLVAHSMKLWPANEKLQELQATIANPKKR